MSSIKEVTTNDFRAEVTEADKLVVVDFWAEWCGPCKKLGPVLEDVAAEIGDDAKIVKVNVDNERTLGSMFQIMSIPSVLFFKDGEKVDEFVGVRSKNDIVAQIKKHI